MTQRRDEKQKQEKAKERNAGVSRTIILVIATLGAGGAERVMTMLAGEWARRGNRVVLLTLGNAGDDYFPVADCVKRVGLDLLRESRGPLDAVRKNFRRLSALRAAIKAENPDAVISFIDATNVLVLMATVGLRAPVIVSERIDPRHYPIAGGWDWLRRKLYPKAAAVAVQTPAVAEWAREFVSAEKVHVIPNPVALRGELRITNCELQIDEAPAADNLDFLELPDWLPHGPFVMAMGRLDRQKGFDLLLRAFASLTQEFGNYSLLILGEGSERTALDQFAKKLGIAERVIMPGRVKEPGSVLSRAKCFVLSSRFEGFPNALLEAMAAGLPVISFDCPSGPANIISHEQNGLLVEPEDTANLSASIARVLGDRDLSRRLGDAAQAEMRKYSLERVTDQWEQLFSVKN